MEDEMKKIIIVSCLMIASFCFFSVVIIQYQYTMNIQDTMKADVEVEYIHGFLIEAYRKSGDDFSESVVVLQDDNGITTEYTIVSDVEAGHGNEIVGPETKSYHYLGEYVCYLVTNESGIYHYIDVYDSFSYEFFKKVKW